MKLVEIVVFLFILELGHFRTQIVQIAFISDDIVYDTMRERLVINTHTLKILNDIFFLI